MFEVKADSDRNFEALTRRLLDARGPRSAWRSRRTTCARSRTRSPTTGSTGGADAGPRAAGPARPRRPAAARGRGPGPARPHLLPGRRPRGGHGLPRAPPAREHRNDSFLADQAQRRRARGAARRAVSLPAFVNEPVLELRRAPVRAQLADALRDTMRAGRSSVPVRVGARRARATPSSRPTPARPTASSPPPRRRREAEVDAALERRARRRIATGAGARRPSAPRCSSRAAALAARAPARGRRARGARVREAVARGRRGRLRGDRLPRVLRARGDRAGGRRASCSSSRASATRCATRPRGVVAVISPWNFPRRDPVRDGRPPGSRPATRSCSSRPSRRRAARSCSSARCARPACRRTRSRCCPARARWAPRSCATRACTRSPSRAPRRSGSRSCGRRPRHPPASSHLKRVIAEMGGKNCVIVDADADLDEVVPALVKSAFVYAGQKCSAAARVLVPRGDPRRRWSSGSPARSRCSRSGRPSGSTSTCRR